MCLESKLRLSSCRHKAMWIALTDLRPLKLIYKETLWFPLLFLFFSPEESLFFPTILVGFPWACIFPFNLGDHSLTQLALCNDCNYSSILMLHPDWKVSFQGSNFMPQVRQFPIIQRIRYYSTKYIRSKKRHFYKEENMKHLFFPHIRPWVTNDTSWVIWHP